MREWASSAASSPSKDQPANGAWIASIASTSARKSGSFRRSSRPIPHHWGPWPGKTNVSEGVCPLALPRRIWGPESPRTIASRAARASAREPATIAARWSCWPRRAPSEWARFRRENAPSIPTIASRIVLARSISASGPRADSGSTWATSARSAASRSLTASTPRSTTWAFVPPNPNELTPAIGKVSGRGQAPNSSWTRRPSASNAMCGLGDAKWRLGGRARCLIASAALMRPAIPAAASRWPRFVLAEPTAQGLDGSRPAERTAPRAPASIGSPSRVPVPWASTYWTSPGATPEAA